MVYIFALSFFFSPLKVSIETFNGFRAIKSAIAGFKDPRQSPKKTPFPGSCGPQKTAFFCTFSLISRTGIQGRLGLAAKVKNSKRLIWREKQSLATPPKGRGYKPRRNRGGVVSDFGVYLEGTPNGPPRTTWAKPQAAGSGL